MTSKVLLLDSTNCGFRGIVVVFGFVFAATVTVGATAPSSNGDVNADSRVDISDPVYILSHLFLGGPRPVSIETGVRRLPATGQTKCLDANGNEIPTCEVQRPPGATPVRWGDDGAYQAGCPMLGRFVDNGDGTVTDHCTGLMWQKDTANVDHNAWIDEADMLPWGEAIWYGEHLELGGHRDWRLPNVNELLSIVDYGRRGPAIPPLFSVEWEDSVSYWTSTSCTTREDPAEAFSVFFRKGGVGIVSKQSAKYVRAVRSTETVDTASPVSNGDVNGDGRLDISDTVYLLTFLFLGGPPPSPFEPNGHPLPATGQTTCFNSLGVEIPTCTVVPPLATRPVRWGDDGGYEAGCPMKGRFVDNGDGTVTDHCTGLMWQKDTPDIDHSGGLGQGDKLKREEAIWYCEDLELGGYRDWRLPNIRELFSLIDFVHWERRIAPVFDVGSTAYLSSTCSPNGQWILGVYYTGPSLLSDLLNQDVKWGYVRAVRGGL